MDGQLLWQMAEQACSGMLGLPIVCCDAPLQGVALALSAQIKISGDADALLSFRSESAFAKHLAATMFMVDGEELSEEEIHDALGELVNILAGNIKGMIPGETLLSLPCVGAAISLSSKPLDEDVAEIAGTCEGYAFCLRFMSSTLSAIPA